MSLAWKGLTMTDLDKHVVVHEVGLRDGLQSLSTVMPTDDKKRWIDTAYEAGIRHMEVTSFVPARLLPQLADARQIVAHALSYPDLLVTALAPNLKGAEAAFEAGVHRLVVPVSVSEAHSLANVRKSREQIIAEFALIKELRDAQSPTTLLIGGLSTAFGCTLGGMVPIAHVQDMAMKVIAAGCDLIAVSDTTGFAHPGHVDVLLSALKPLLGSCPLIAHFHDTRGLALANSMIALQHGIREFDGSLAGIGGCPHAPGASGNVATEDLVFLFNSLGYDSGIDIEKLLASRFLLQQALAGESLFGALARAGLPKDYTETCNDLKRQAEINAQPAQHVVPA